MTAIMNEMQELNTFNHIQPGKLGTADETAVWISLPPINHYIHPVYPVSMVVYSDDDIAVSDDEDDDMYHMLRGHHCIPNHY